jgi:hypothetical protein
LVQNKNRKSSHHRKHKYCLLFIRHYSQHMIYINSFN